MHSADSEESPSAGAAGVRDSTLAQATNRMMEVGAAEVRDTDCSMAETTGSVPGGNGRAWGGAMLGGCEPLIRRRGGDGALTLLEGDGAAG